MCIRDSHYVEEFSVRGDLTNFFDEKNKFKAGFNFQFQQMQVIDIYKPWIGELGLNNDIYKVYPALGSLYAQDNICLLYTSPSPRDRTRSRMPSSA